MQEKKGSLKKDFNGVQKKEDPGKNEITGQAYKKSVEDRPISKSRTDRINRVKQVQKEFEDKNKKLGEIRKRKLGGNKPSPSLRPKGMSAGSKARPKSQDQVRRNRERLERVQQRLNDKYKVKANNAEQKGRKSESFNKSKVKDVAKDGFDKVR